MEALVYRLKNAHSAIGLPSPVGYPIIGVLPHVRRNPLRFFVELVRDFGDVVLVDLGFNKVLMLNKPEYIKHVLQDNHRNYHKSKFYGPLRPIFGEGIITAEDDAWLHQRLAAAKNFNGKCIHHMCQAMTEAISDTLDSWEKRRQQGNAALEISSEMAHVTLDILVRTLFGVRLAGEHKQIYEALTTTLREAERRIWSVLPMPTWAPTSHNFEARNAIRVLESFVDRVIAERQASLHSNRDLLSLLIETQGSGIEGGGSRQLLRDQVLTFLMAGHETTANGLAWAWYTLSKNPVVERSLREEVEQVLKGRVPTFSDLSKLVYTKMVFEETLRLHPPVWTISRSAVADDFVNGIRIPKGTTVMVCPYALHRRSDLWPNPEGFDPQRFAPGVEKLQYAYLPFGSGPRKCLGNRFALTEAMLLLAMVAQRYRLELVPGQTIEPEPMITLRPRYGISMHLRDTSKLRENVSFPQPLEQTLCPH